MNSRSAFYLGIFTLCGLATTLSAQTEKQKEMRRKQQKNAERQQLMMRLTSIQYNPVMKEELNIVDDQIKDLQKISQAFHKDLRKFNLENTEKMMSIQELHRKGETQKAMKISMEYQAKMFKICDDHFKEVEKMLLPHQVKRLMQISKQEMLKHMSGFQDEFGIVYAVADEVGLTTSEKSKLKDAIEKARQKYYAEVVKLKEKAHAEIRRAIPKDKQDKVDDIVGDIFDQVRTQRTSREATKPKKK